MNPVEEFLGIKKEAGFLGGIFEGLRGGVGRAPLGEAMEARQAVGRAFGEQLVPAAVGLSLIGAGHVGVKAYSAVRDRITKARDYKKMISANPSLKHEPAKKVQMVFDSLRHMAPDMSKDPLVAGSFVRNTLELSPESGPAIATQTAKMLVDTQKNMKPGHRSMVVDAIMSSKAPWGPLMNEREDRPFSVNPSGMSGSFASEQDAKNFARRTGIRPSGQIKVRHGETKNGPFGVVGFDVPSTKVP
jgi:hypothetical protein